MFHQIVVGNGNVNILQLLIKLENFRKAAEGIGAISIFSLKSFQLGSVQIRAADYFVDMIIKDGIY